MHMGEPQASFVIINWIYKLFGMEGDVGQHIATIRFKPKF